ncbi:hypothetical protein Pst134EB_022262 [Puccinia striiformis f. sp. tritici]|nr:hypothetical protein Pst134EB_022262 [Puccinia striiformis f. sp. tritici]
MPVILANLYLFQASVTWYLALGRTLAFAQPALQGLSDNQFIGSTLQSSQEDLFEVYNRGKLLGQKHRSEGQPLPPEPESSGVDNHWTGFGVPSDYLVVQNEEDDKLNVAKRRKTVQHDSAGPSLPPKLGYYSPTGAIYDGMSHAAGFEEAQDHQAGHDSYQFASFASSTPSSPLPPFIPNITPYSSPLSLEGQHSETVTPKSISESGARGEMGTTAEHLSTPGPLVRSKYPEFGPFDPRRWSSFVDRVQRGHSSLPRVQLGSSADLPRSREHSTVEYNPRAGRGHAQLPDSNQTDRQQHIQAHTSTRGPSALGDSHVGLSSDNFFERVNKKHPVPSNQPNEEDGAPVPDESSSDSGNDEHKLLQLKPNSVPPEKVIFPQNTMDDEFLGSFTNKFRDRISNLFTRANTRLNKNDHPIKGLPVKISRNTKENSYIIRIELDGEVAIKGKQSPNHNQKSVKLSDQMSRLIRWLLFINAAVLRNLSLDEVMEHGELSYHKALTDWLFKEAFQPKNSLPVLGIISNAALDSCDEGKEFGQIQKILIRYLSLITPPREDRQAALSILRIYYEHSQPELWKALGSLDGVDFDQGIKLIIANEIRSKMKVGSGSDLGNANRNLGNFLVYELENFPKSMKPLSFQLSCDVGLGKKEVEILKHFSDTFSENRKYTTSRQRSAPELLPVVISRTSHDREGRTHGEVWIQLKNGRIPRKGHIFLKLRSLVANLKVCHAEFVDYASTKGFHVDVDIQHLFFQWFYNNLFNPGNEKLPIFGKFVLEDQKKEDSVISASRFNDAQIFLLHFFGDSKSFTRTVQVALALIGYWHKNQKKGVFPHLFQNDQEYWDVVINLLENKYEFDGVSSLRWFSKD